MSELSNLIFKGKKHYITSTFGTRNIISTSAGSSSSIHQGTDYGTNSMKLPQYAVENGYVFAAAKSNTDGAYYIWVIYPRIKLAMLHYHLDSISVSAGKKVIKGTLLGYTGKTGKATGIHLHLGAKNLSGLSDSRINTMTWDSLRSIPYTDPESIKYSSSDKETKINNKVKGDFLPSKGYFSKGDVSSNIGRIASFMRKVFPTYTDKKALGNTFGPYLFAAVTEFQKRTGLKADGMIGQKTIDKLKDFGFSEK